MNEKGNLILEETRLYPLVSHLFGGFLLVVLLFIGSIIGVAVIELVYGTIVLVTNPIKAIFFLIVAFCVLVVIFVRMICRTKIRIYTNGMIPRYRPLNYVLKSREFFIPWDKTLHITFFDAEKHSLSGVKVCKKPPRWYPQQKWWFYGVEIKKGHLIYIDQFTFKEPSLHKLKSLNLELRPNFVDWENFRKISKGSWTM